MKRFLLVLALVAVAGATYVATASSSQTAGPTARQFRALKTEVAHLKTKLNNTSAYAHALSDFVFTCVTNAPVGVNSSGDSSTGYLFGAPGTPPASATSQSALNLDTSGTPTYKVFVENQTEPICDLIINGADRHALKRLEAFAKR